MPEAIIAVGMAYLIIAGGFDLSVGSVMALAGVGVAWLLKSGVSPALAIPFGLAIGATAGTINGLMVTKARVNPLIATLAMMWVARGIAQAATESKQLADLPASFAMLGQGFFFGIVPVSVALMVVIVITADLMARKSQVARQVYYVGGNENAARFSGISVGKVRLVCYLLSGFLRRLPASCLLPD